PLKVAHHARPAPDLAAAEALTTRRCDPPTAARAARKPTPRGPVGGWAAHGVGRVVLVVGRPVRDREYLGLLSGHSGWPQARGGGHTGGEGTTWSRSLALPRRRWGKCRSR